ncbi:MAG: MoaD/ThiS family protein [Chloroflexota bacterium]|nr:MoaD/ThiS family protein [Chloroflexota bacterium]MDE3101228.1 MoaD/ThiS family protein [Chloroflexota bacterium]
MARVTVRLHGAFSEMAGGVRHVAIDARTVGEALDVLPGELPGLRERIRDEQGRIRQHLNVFRNEDEIRRLKGEKTPLREGDVLTLVPAMSGGD